MLLLCGCSWIHWRENPSGESMIDAGPEKSCSLELAQDRKSLPRRVLALGTPTLLVIRVGTQSEPDRLVRNGQAIYFAAGKLNVEASDFSHAQRTWKIEALDSAGRRLADSVPIVGSVDMRLLNLQGTGYAQLQAEGTVTAVAGREATDLVIYKADAPDPNRPTTCDRHVRDGDYVFVRAPNQDEWAALDLSGALYLPPASSKPCPTPDSDAESQRCPWDEEVCSNDQRGALICAWSLHCND